MSKTRQTSQATPEPDNLFLRTRLKLGKSQAEMGREVGWTGQYIYLIEKGKAIPPLSAVGKLARAFGVPEHEIEHEIVALNRLHRKLATAKGAA